MHNTVIMVHGDAGQYTVLVPAMPGCFSLGRTRDEALTNIRDAIAGWLQVEAERGRSPLVETTALILDGVSQALTIIDEMRAAGELPQDRGYDLELATIAVPQSIAA